MWGVGMILTATTTSLAGCPQRLRARRRGVLMRSYADLPIDGKWVGEGWLFRRLRLFGEAMLQCPLEVLVEALGGELALWRIRIKHVKGVV